MPNWKWLTSLFSEMTTPQLNPTEEPAANPARLHRDGGKLLTLCQVISRGDHDLVAEVKASVNDPLDYFTAYGKDCPYFKTVADIDPLYAAHYALSRRGYLRCLDHAALTEELVEELTPLLKANGIDQFDWSFVDALEQAEDYEALENGNMLGLIATKLAKRGLVLVSLNMNWDQFDFTILTRDEFSKIAGLNGRDFSVEDKFN